MHGAVAHYLVTTLSRLLEFKEIPVTWLCALSYVMPNQVHSVPTPLFQLVLLNQDDAPSVET